MKLLTANIRTTYFPNQRLLHYIDRQMIVICFWHVLLYPSVRGMYKTAKAG